mmetsp:Transcript_15012/g.42403  ORF Transcript_15012/g.42403 Transcript_15012/m.42403 type:complete len:205 (-) Transcript_15012:498-1112(-)
MVPRLRHLITILFILQCHLEIPFGTEHHDAAAVRLSGIVLGGAAVIAGSVHQMVWIYWIRVRLRCHADIASIFGAGVRVVETTARGCHMAWFAVLARGDGLQPCRRVPDSWCRGDAGTVGMALLGKSELDHREVGRCPVERSYNPNPNHHGNLHVPIWYRNRTIDSDGNLNASECVQNQTTCHNHIGTFDAILHRDVAAHVHIP